MILWYSEVGAPPTQHAIREFCSKLLLQVYIDHALLVSPTSVNCMVESNLGMGNHLFCFLEHDNTIGEMTEVISDLLTFPPLVVQINVNGWLFLPSHRITLGFVLNMGHK